jgi:DNA processing protein
MTCPDDTRIRAAVELTLIPRIGLRTRNRIRDTQPEFQDLFAAGEKNWEFLGISKEAFPAIRNRAFRPAAEEIVEWARKENCRILVYGMPGYPGLLAAIDDPPLVLYARGKLEDFDGSCIAVVGSRRPTVYGLEIARGIARDLGSRGIKIVSGLARGIDGAAHRGCLEGGGRTIAVLGCGIDIVYPPEHARLKEDILKTGCILTEFPPGTGPSPHNFPIRNRIVSGLALGALVVEANEKSGSLITARLALEQNRDVFAIPGNLTSPASYGPNYLIKQGAKLVQSWKDVVEEMPASIRDEILQSEECSGVRPADLRMLSD